MSTSTTRPVALRMTDAERERLLTHGGTARAAVTKLLDLADEHATCAPPRRMRKPPAPQPPMRLEPVPTTQQQGSTSTKHGDGAVYEVQVAGRTVLRTPSKTRADRKAASERERNPNRKVEVR